MNDRVSRVGGRRTRRPERQNPYYRSRIRPMQNEYHGRQLVDDTRSQQTNEWSGRTLNEYALCSNSSQERDRSRYHRHSDRYWDAQSSSLKGSSQSTPVGNSYLPNTHKDFQACRADSLQDFSRQRCAEMAYSNGPSIRSTRFRGQEHRIDQQNLDYDEQQSRSEKTASVSTTRRWSDMVELEELSAEQHNSDFESEYNGLCPEQMNEEFKDVRVQRSSSSHVRQDSLMSNPSLVGSDSTTESKKMRMSATPRFTESELNTKDVQVIIARRKKQIEYGKVLDCYNQYIQLVPRHKRTKYHPRTPDIYRSYSRRGFDTLVRTWKKQLHAWEPAKSLGRSLKLGSTCSSAAAAATEEAIRTFKKEMKEDLDDSDYDSNFPPMPSSAAVKTEGSSELPSVLSSLAAHDESGDSDSPMSGVVVKTEMPDDFI